MKVFVTGATGFVGGAATRALLRRGHQVVALVRDPRRAEALAKLGVECVQGDMEQPQTYVPVLKRVDAVIQAAQRTPTGRVSAAKMRRVFAADELATAALADACAPSGKLLIYTSGCFNYGDCGDALVTEESPLRPSPMGIGHARVVQDLRRRRDKTGLRFITLCGGFVYGAGGLLQTAFYDQLVRGRLRVFGAGKNFWSPVHVDDYGDAFPLALEVKADGETFNIVDDEPIRLRALVDALTDALAMKRVGSVPPWLIALLIGGPLVSSMTTSWRVDNRKAKEVLGWKPAHPTFRQAIPAIAGELKAFAARDPSRHPPAAA